RATSAKFVVRIEHATTDDLPDGQADRSELHIRPDALDACRATARRPHVVAPNRASSITDYPGGCAMTTACRTHLGWISDAADRFLHKIVQRFGRPAKLIEIHHNRHMELSPPSSGVEADANQSSSRRRKKKIK